MKRKTLTTYLRKYAAMQDEIILCYRPQIDSGWSNRCAYLDEKYDPFLPYNHRSVLMHEVVIEFDEDSRELNKQLAHKVADKLSDYKIPYSMWFSGGKSTHLHCFIKARNASSLSLLKRCFIRYFTGHLEYRPDLQLTGNHLIRAEFGIHEKSQERKTLVKESPSYPKEATIPKAVWDMYNREMEIVQKRMMTIAIKDIDDDNLVKKILDTAYIREHLKDGRKRLIGALAQLLRHKYSNRNELIDFLWKWYTYCNGKDLTYGQVAYQVHYAYRNPMDNPFAFLYSVAKDLGLEEIEVTENKEETHDNEPRGTN